MSTTIDSLNIQITTASTQAEQKILDLARALDGLKSSSKITTAVNGLNKLASALNTLNPALNSLNTAKLNSLRGTMMGLGNISKLSGLNSALNTLKKLPEVVNGLDDAALAQFAKQMAKLGKALKPVADRISAVSSAFTRLPANIKRAVTATESMGRAAQNMAGGVDAGNHNLMTFLSNFEQFRQYADMIIQKMGNIIATAIEWDGIQYRFGRAFGEDAEEVYAHVLRINEVMGISIQEFMQYSSLYGSLLSGFGLAQEKVTTISVGLTELSYDIWAAYNDRFKSLEQASEAVRSAITGEIEPIRNAGIALTEASLQEYIDSTHLAGISIEKLSEAQKAEVRYAAMVNAAMNQGIVGTYAAEMQTAEGAVRSLSQSFKTLKQAFGGLFIPILQVAIPYLTAFVELLTEAVHWIAALFGVELMKIDWGASTGGVGDLAAGASEATDNLKDAAGAAKKLKDYTMGFDELNVIDPDKGSGGKSAAAGGGADFGAAGGLDLDTLWDDAIFEKASQQISGLKEKLRGLWDEWKEELGIIAGLFGVLSIAGLLGQLGQALDLGDKFAGVLTGIKKAAALGILLTVQYSVQSEFFKNFIQTGEWESYIWAAITGALGAFGSYLLWGKTGLVLSLTISAITAFKATFEDGSLDSVEEAATGLTGLASAAGAAGLAFKLLKNTDIGAFFALLKEGEPLMGTLAAAFPGLAAFFTKIGTAVSAAVTAIAGALGISVGWVVAIAAAIVAAIALVIIYWDEIKAFFTDTIPKLWKKFTNWIGDVADAVSDWFGNAAADIAEFFTMCWDKVVSIWSKAADWFDRKVVQPIIDFFSPIASWFAKLFSNIWATVSDVFYNIGVVAKGCWEIIKAAWKIAADWFNKTVIEPLSDFFSKTWDNIKNWAVSAWDGIKSVYGKISGWVSEKIIQPVSKFFSDMWQGFLTKAKSAWEGVKSVFSKVGQFFGDTFKAAWKKVVDVFSVAGEIFVDIKDGVVSAFKKIVNGIITGINKVVSVPFNAINSALELVKSVEILNMKPFADLKTITVPEIPLLASGGMVSAGQMFVARENGPELVSQFGNRTAVMNNDQIVAAVSQGVYSAVRAAMSGEGSGSQNVNVYLDGKQIYSSVKKTERERGLSLMGSQLGYSY